MTGLAGLLAAVLAGLGGLLVPRLIARVPEPAAEPEPEAGGALKESYASIAATPGLGVRAALVSAVAGGLLGARVGWQPPLLGLVPLVPVCVALAIVDLRTRLLPRLVVLPATAALLAVVVLDALVRGQSADLVRALVGLVVARSFFWVLWRVHSAGMGFGDVRLAALLGLALGWLGWAELLVGLYAGLVLFAVPALLVAVVRRDREALRRSAAYGPFLVAGALAGVLVGPLVLPGLAIG